MTIECDRPKDALPRRNRKPRTALIGAPEPGQGFGEEPTAAPGSPEKSLQDLVHALTVSIEKRDPYTFDHQTKVTRLAVGIAEEMGLEAEALAGLRLAASVHDIGKIVIPLEILNRPSRLTATEFALIRTHAQIGYEMLLPISFPWPVADIVHQHHERGDGSGYPNGLTSEQTLLEAKILAVADVIEAMSSHRPYRAALGLDAALDEVAKQTGVLYDDEVVSACVRLLLLKHFRFDHDGPGQRVGTRFGAALSRKRG